ncbi:MAG: GNAT family N-acetyltransferase [Paracoccaceae bacterium]
MTVTVGLTDDLAQALAIRRIVFIEGQNVPEDREVDGCDGEALHLLLVENDVAIGTARLMLEGETGKIGRVAVLKEHRGRGFGIALIEKSYEVLREHGAARAKLGAQTYAIGFYEKLGFTVQGPEYIDAGIPHRDMVRPL